VGIIGSPGGAAYRRDHDTADHASAVDMTTAVEHRNATQHANTAGRLRQLGVDSAYILIGFPLALIGFVLLVTGISLAGGLLITLIGVPVLALTLIVARGLAQIERIRIAPVLRIGRTVVAYRRAPEGAGFWRRVVTPLGDGQTWLDLLHGVVGFVPATVTWAITVTWWSTAVTGSLYWAYEWALPDDGDGYHDLAHWLGLPDTTASRILVYTAVGLLFLLTLPFVVRALAVGQARFSQVLLTGLAGLRTQIAGLQVSAESARAATRAAASAEATALRRLERDIHDGPQQRLVRIAVDLGRAQQQLVTDPEAVPGTVEEALAQTREALEELRTLSRGIAPPILTDRGLPAALSALAVRCTVPVELDVPELPRASALAEQTAYFAVAEALTNVAKHSGATRCSVLVREAAGRLALIITDDGAGGAHLAKGHGLAGLADRLEAAGGRLRVASPAGGPTTISAELPWPTDL
jgi:signal transduction histidine kinase